MKTKFFLQKKIRFDSNSEFAIKIAPQNAVSGASLVFFNIISLIFGILEGWGFVEFVFLYWIQSMIIGGFQFFKILRLKRIEAIDKTGEKIYISQTTKNLIAVVFLFHYNTFHYLYFSFLNSFFEVDFLKILPAGGFFLVNHFISFIINKNEAEKKRSLNFLIGFPYLRILPIHLMIIFGFSIFQEGLMSFMIFIFLKICIDLIMHLIEHSFEN